MKVNVYQNPDGRVIETTSDSKDSQWLTEKGYILLGTLDLNIEKPKKAVTKEIKTHLVETGNGNERWVEARSPRLPSKAINVRILYDIEEEEK